MGGAKPAKLSAHLLCGMYCIKELARPSVQERAVVLSRLSLCASASRTSQCPESCLMRNLGPVTCMETARFFVCGFK